MSNKHNHINTQLLEDLEEISNSGLAFSIGTDYGKRVLDYASLAFTPEEKQFYEDKFRKIKEKLLPSKNTSNLIDFKGKSLMVMDDLEGLVFDTFSREIDGCMLCMQLYQSIINKYVKKGEETVTELEESIKSSDEQDSIESSNDDNYEGFLAGIIKKLKNPGEHDFLNLL